MILEFRVAVSIVCKNGMSTCGRGGVEMVLKLGAGRIKAMQQCYGSFSLLTLLSSLLNLDFLRLNREDGALYLSW